MAIYSYCQVSHILSNPGDMSVHFPLPYVGKLTPINSYSMIKLGVLGCMFYTYSYTCILYLYLLVY